MRTVSNQGVWHTINPSTGEVTKLVVGTNWNWDSHGQSSPKTRNHRGWVIIEGSSIWTEDYWDDTDDSEWGDGGTWGSDATPEEVQGLRGIVRKWMRAGNFVPAVIVTFDDSLFEETDASPPNPDAPDNWNLAEVRLTVNANFWAAVRIRGA